MRNAAARGFVLVAVLALFALAAVVPAPVLAESTGTGGAPIPDDTVVSAASTTTVPSSGLSAAELLALYLSIL